MISRTHRFHGNNSLNYTYRHGKTVRCQQLSLKYTLNAKRRSYRVAIVVSRKVHKSAVVRNRIRRRIYEIIRHHEADIAAPYDIVMTVFSEQLADMPAAELEGQVLKLLSDAGIVG